MVDEQLTDKQLDAMQKTLEKTETALVQATNQPLGKAIIQEALKAYDEKRKSAVIGEVQRLMSCRDDAKAILSLTTKQIAWFEKKLAAIEAGEFEFTERGQILCHDQDLQRANF